MCIKIIYFLPPPPFFFSEIISVISVTHWIQRIWIKLRASLIMIVIWQKIHCLIFYLYLQKKFSSFLFYSELWKSFLLVYMLLEIFIIPLLFWIMRILFAGYYAEKQNMYMRTHTDTGNSNMSLYSVELWMLKLRA